MITVSPELYRPSTFVLKGMIDQLKPAMTVEGSKDVEIQIDGQGFSDFSVVRFGNTPVLTQLVSPARLKAVVPSRLLQVAGTYPVTVESPPPGGGTSNPYGFIVRFP